MSVKFADLKLDAGTRKKVDMSDEWGDGAVIWSEPVTPIDLKKVAKRHPDVMQRPSLEAIIDLLIIKATNANDERFFTLEDKPALMRRPISEIEKAAQCLGEVDLSDEKIEDEEKN